MQKIETLGGSSGSQEKLQINHSELKLPPSLDAKAGEFHRKFSGLLQLATAPGKPSERSIKDPN